jgi:type II secretory pathway pseudopilin PulG
MRRRLPPSDALRRRGREGYSLVEVIISILLASVIVTSVFSVVLTSKSMNGQHGRNDRHQVAGQAVKEVSSVLRNFVTGCCDPSTGVCKTTNIPYACYGKSGPISGPNSTNASYTWSLDGYTMNSGATIEDDWSAAVPYACPSSSGGGTRDTYALYTGTHCLYNILPAWFTSAPYNATISYTIDNSESVAFTAATFPSAGYMPKANVVVNWTEP